jgi:Flp pilus assembly protein TadG
MVHRPLSPLGRRDDGAVAILTILLTSVVFIGLCALVVDLGLARDTRRQAQNAADASALAAGNVLYINGSHADINGAVAAAQSYVDKNLGVTLSTTDWAHCSDPDSLGHPTVTACISFNDDTTPTAVRVKIPDRVVSTPFAGIWGRSSVPVSAVAQVGFDTGGKAKCGLCVIGSGNHVLQEGNITVNGASVAINGTLVEHNSNGSITVTGTGEDISLQGAVPTQGTYSPLPVLVNQPPITDPLASLVMPDYTGFVAKTNSCTQGPGIYVSLTACPGGMLPGLYVLTGASGGNFGVVGNGVTLYLTCSTSGVPHTCATTGEKGASIAFGGGGTSYLDITAPVAGQPNAGLAIVADRNLIDPANNTPLLSFGGNGTANSGTIYAASGTLAYNGNGSLGTNSLIVVNDISFAGSPSAFVSSYTQDKNVTVPPSLMHLSQ